MLRDVLACGCVFSSLFGWQPLSRALFCWEPARAPGERPPDTRRDHQNHRAGTRHGAARRLVPSRSCSGSCCSRADGPPGLCSGSCCSDLPLLAASSSRHLTGCPRGCGWGCGSASASCLRPSPSSLSSPCGGASPPPAAMATATPPPPRVPPHAGCPFPGPDPDRGPCPCPCPSPDPGSAPSPARGSARAPRRPGRGSCRAPRARARGCGPAPPARGSAASARGPCPPAAPCAAPSPSAAPRASPTAAPSAPRRAPSRTVRPPPAAALVWVGLGKRSPAVRRMRRARARSGAVCRTGQRTRRGHPPDLDSVREDSERALREASGARQTPVRREGKYPCHSARCGRRARLREAAVISSSALGAPCPPAAPPRSRRPPPPSPRGGR